MYLFQSKSIVFERSLVRLILIDHRIGSSSHRSTFFPRLSVREGPYRPLVLLLLNRKLMTFEGVNHPKMIMMMVMMVMMVMMMTTTMVMMMMMMIMMMMMMMMMIVPLPSLDV